MAKHTRIDDPAERLVFTKRAQALLDIAEQLAGDNSSDVLFTLLGHAVMLLCAGGPAPRLHLAEFIEHLQHALDVMPAALGKERPE